MCIAKITTFWKSSLVTAFTSSSNFVVPTVTKTAILEGGAKTTIVQPTGHIIMVRLMSIPLLQKSSRLTRWTQPLRNAIDDYMQVAKDTRESVKSHPYRFTIMCLIGGALTAMWLKNPDHHSYTEEVLCYSNEISQCSEHTRNKEAHRYVSDVINKQCTGLLCHINLGVLSVVITTPSYKECYIYPQRCSYLQPKWNDYWTRIVDIGFWNQWWFLKKQMTNFDINEDESSE